MADSLSEIFQMRKGMVKHYTKNITPSLTIFHLPNTEITLLYYTDSS
jgi:hypothetical protein